MSEECDYYKNGKCTIYNSKCVGIDNENCPIVVEFYDPYASGDCDEF